MAYQLPPMALRQWRPPQSGVSLNYVPQQQQIGSPANAAALAQTMLPADLTALIAKLNPQPAAAPLAQPNMQQTNLKMRQINDRPGPWGQRSSSGWGQTSGWR